ncbi:ATP-binding cassette domain-containing protein [Thiohalomonas denitrificans]|uniref:Zinc transport system ATP-binding protein n=1 Tax=Thiohalomonas denitrificans TaxID=415747 RepID=A0A1G5PPU6_9GAMM|nr:ATP-binding cassette domain-containing protein [Thiohalomonas denitrificans]SCZ51574.1 zinc transport system ATP-binding protein [Thiohalomonas denitrificans]
MADPQLLAEVRGVTVRFGNRTVLDNIDLAVHEREIVTLIGPNGAGKSTLVRIMLGLHQPGAGRVRRPRGVTVGYVPQRLNVDPVLPLTVRRFLSLYSRMDRQQMIRALGDVDAQALLEVSLHNLSGGELQRVLLARALLRQPQLLVLDEPVQGVDVNGQTELYELIAGLRDQRGCGVLMVSHDLHLVMARTDRVFCLDQQMCCTGRPEQVRGEPAFRAMFRNQTGLVPYTHHHEDGSESEGWCGQCREGKNHHHA